MSDKNGGPAFPQNEPDARGYITVESGMTLCDYFAAAAMQAIISNNTLFERQFFGMPGDRIKHELAEMAYLQADAMLSARKS